MSTKTERGADSQQERGPELLSVIVVNAIVDALEVHQVDVSPALIAMRDRFRLDHRATVSRRAFLIELERACASSADPAIALTVGESLNEMSFHFVGPVIAGQPNLRDTLDMFLRVMAHVVGGPRWSAVRYGADVIVGYKLERELGAGAEREAEIFITVLQRSLVHWLGPSHQRAVSAQFGFAAPRYVDRFRALFGAQLRFGEVLTGVRYPVALMDQVRPGASPELVNGLRELGELLHTNPAEPRKR